MATDLETVETKDTVPLWLAIAITVCVSLPFALWLGRWNLPVWVSFIVWAEYFALGAKWQALIKIVPAYITGVLAASGVMTFYLWLSKEFAPTYWVKPNDIAMFVSCFIAFCVYIYAMKYVAFVRDNTLPFFNGVSMGLAVFFTSAFVAPFVAHPSVYALPWFAAVGAILAGMLGAFLGWFNVAIMFTHPVHKLPPGAPPIEQIPDTSEVSR